MALEKFELRKALLLILACFAACSSDSVDSGAPSMDAGNAAVDLGPSAPDMGADTGADMGAGDAGEAPPLELTPNLCDDPSNLALLMDALGSGGPSFGEVNPEQLQRMFQAPTEGPFYMVNLIRFREMALYPDGRPTDLTGREANALYSPTEFIAAIGARPVFVGEVDETVVGQAGFWHQVAIVEYPCPLALFAMSAHPEFQARSIHKEAGVEVSTVMVTHLRPLGDVETTETPFPSTAEDPAFELVQVIHHRDQALYAPGSNEPARTGLEAMAVYTATVSEANRRFGVTPKARLQVQGVFIGDGRVWDEVWIDLVPSRAAYDALSADPAVTAVLHHREAALEDAYGLTTFPMISAIPGSEGPGPMLPPVTPDGTGTLCQMDVDCPGDGVNKCLTDGAGGFCTREGCGAGECQSPYACCHDCNEAIASMLPFDGSACLPEAIVPQLTAAPVSCTCD